MRFAHSLASEAGLPGSGGIRYPTDSGKLLVRQIAQFPQLAGSGVQLAPQQEHEGSALVVLPDLNFLFAS